LKKFSEKPRGLDITRKIYLNYKNVSKIEEEALKSNVFNLIPTPFDNFFGKINIKSPLDFFLGIDIVKTRVF
jgi:hypothetical protein